MATVVIINGPAGVGKTTAAEAFCRSRSSSAHVSGDALKRAVDWSGSDPLRWTTYRTGACVCRELLDAGIDWVVFDFVFSEREQVLAFIEKLGEPSPRIVVVTLWASEGVLSRRRIERSDPIDAHYQSLIRTSRARLQPNLNELGHLIVTDKLTRAEVAATLEELVEGLLRVGVGQGEKMDGQ